MDSSRMGRRGGGIVPRGGGIGARGGRALGAILVFAAAIVLEGCGTTAPSAASMAAAPMPVVAMAAPDAASSASADSGVSGLAVAWAARPAFVNTTADTEAAYSYAFHNPQIVQWMPCYCGCARMDHRSNLDCYLKRGVAGKAADFEEHASYCDICVRITLETKRLIAEGRSLREVRQAVDQAFGGGSVEGTPTELPPA